MNTHPIIHFLHDAGAAAWFGGSLMGATSLNAAAAQLDDPTQRASASTAGWSRWAPANAAAIGAHLIGGAGLMGTDWQRVKHQEGVGRSTAIKLGTTGVALGVAAWSAALNRKMAAAGAVPVKGATEPGAMTPPDVAKTQRQLKLVQWLNPLVSGALVGLGSWHEEQQRPSQVIPGLLKSRSTLLLPAAAAVGFGVLASRRQKSQSTTVTAYPAPALASRPPSTTQTTAPVYGANGTTGAAGTPGASTTGAGTTGAGTTSTDVPPIA